MLNNISELGSIVTFPLIPKVYVVVTILLVPPNVFTSKLPKVILKELTHVFNLKPFVALPPASVETPSPNLSVCELDAFTCAVLFV